MSSAYDAPYSTKNSPYDGVFPQVIQAPVDDDIIPTKDEMTEGMLKLENMNRETTCDTQFCPIDVWENQTGPYAPFDPAIFATME